MFAFDDRCRRPGARPPCPLAVLADGRLPPRMWEHARAWLERTQGWSGPVVCGYGAESWQRVAGAVIRTGLPARDALAREAARTVVSGPVPGCAVVTADDLAHAPFLVMREAGIRTVALMPTQNGARCRSLERLADWWAYLPGEPADGPCAPPLERERSVAAVADALSAVSPSGGWATAEAVLAEIHRRQHPFVVGLHEPQDVIDLASPCAAFQVRGDRLRRRRLALDA